MASSPGPSSTRLTTQLLDAVAQGDMGAARELVPAVYDELKRIARGRMRRLPPGQTLQTTALVHEAFLKLDRADDPGWSGRAHFFGAAARAMRDILVDQVRRKTSKKRGGDRRRVEKDDLPDIAFEGSESELLDLNDALVALEESHARAAEVVSLRFFAGLSMDEIAGVVGISTPSVERDWRFARSWLQRRMRGDSGDDA